MTMNYNELQRELEDTYGYGLWPDRDVLMAALTHNVCTAICTRYDDGWRRTALVTLVGTVITRLTEHELGYATASADTILEPDTDRTRERTRNKYVAKTIEVYKKTRLENPIRLRDFRWFAYDTLRLLNDTKHASESELLYLGNLAYYSLSAIEALDDGELI